MNKRISPALQRLTKGLPVLMQALDQAVTEALQSDQHTIILVIGHQNVSQYMSNAERSHGVEVLRDLFMRWQLDLDEILPDEHEPDDTRAFQYLLDQFEQSCKAPDPAEANYAGARSELLTFVGRLQLKAKR
jgi:hypothetical protein